MNQIQSVHLPAKRGSVQIVAVMKKLISLKRTWLITAIILIVVALCLNPHLFVPINESALISEPHAWDGYFSFDLPSILGLLGVASLLWFLWKLILEKTKANQ